MTLRCTMSCPPLLLIAPAAMIRTAAFDRANALAKAMQLPLHIVAFDYLQALAVAGLFAPEQIGQARKGTCRPTACGWRSKPNWHASRAFMPRVK